MSQDTREKIAEFMDRKAAQYPRLDLKDRVPKEDRLNRFI